jgi:diguanylate cyclase (GGDEF)-like protein
MEITWRDVFWREHIFRWVLIVLSVILAQFGEEYIGGPINYSMLYGIAIIFGALNILYIIRPDQCTYQGKYRYPIAFLDLVYICLIIQATGGVMSNFYLVLGVLPLIAGAYFGMWGAPAYGALIIIAYTIIVLFDSSDPANLSALLALHYGYIIFFTLLDTYISGVAFNDRQKLTILFKISQSGSSSPALFNVIENIAEVVAKTFKADKVLIYLNENGDQELSLQKPAYGINDDDFESFSSASSGLASLDPATIGTKSISLHAGTSDTSVNEAVFPPFAGLRNCLIVPLYAASKSIGFLVICDKISSRRFSRRDARLLELISSHISLYLENAVLYRSSEENVAQLTSLIRVVDAIGSVASIDHIYNLALDVVRGLFAADMALINIINHDTGLLEPVRSFGFGEKYREHNISQPFERIESCYVLTTDRSFLSDDVTHDERCPNLRVEKGVKSILCVPIKSGNTAYGILHLASRYNAAFNQSDTTLANAIGEQVGMAVERARLFDEINRLAITDALTGLYNRRYLANILEEEVKRSARYAHPLSFVMIDIDHFKFYNDRHGHPMGDEVLRTLARLLRESVRDVDTVFRYGGEEFSVLAPELDKEDVSFLAERLRKVVKNFNFPYEEEQPEGNLTISLGVASFPYDAADGAELIQRSDQALYLAKRQGRDRVSLYLQPG